MLPKYKNVRLYLGATIILFCFFPILVFAVKGANFFISFNESLAYRYFYVYRMLSGEINPYLMMPQGFVTTTIHKLIFLIEKKIVFENNLKLSLQLFGYLSFIVNGLIASVMRFLIIKMLTNNENNPKPIVDGLAGKVRNNPKLISIL